MFLHVNKGRCTPHEPFIFFHSPLSREEGSAGGVREWCEGRCCAKNDFFVREEVREEFSVTVREEFSVCFCVLIKGGVGKP